jgi:hypothetical protein
MRVEALMAIEVAAFLLVIGETYLFFVVIVPLGQVPHGLADYTTTALLKVGLTFGLGALWLAVVESLTRLYVRSKLGTPTPSPSS